MKFHTSAALWIAFATASSVDAFRVTSRPSVTLRPWRTALRAEGTKITMPALSSTMKEGRVVSWLKNEGDEIEAGEAIMVVESDKADMDVEAFEDGVLAKILVPEGAMAPVGEAVALMAENAADVASVIASLGAGSSASEPVLDAPAPTSGTYVSPVASTPATTAPASPATAPAAPQAAAPRPAGERVTASPLARKKAQELGVDLNTVTGTGPSGRVTASDIEAAASGTAPPRPSAVAHAAANGAPAVELPEGVVPMTGMQRAVSNNMVATLPTPEFRVTREIQMDAFDALYQKLKPNGITVSAMLAKAVALAIEKHPIINSSFSEEGGGSIVYKKDINIAMAVAIDGGLITPVLQYANERSVVELGENWKELVGKAKSGTLAPAEYNSGTFAISNMGMFGVTHFGAILPKGIGGILAIGATQEMIVPDQSAILGMKKVKKMSVTLTCDHRQIYGADAALFLKTLADMMENQLGKITA
ncbi:predicted protein [Phaeodactylum tricornutum CCAP 1055/1]|uniref:Dihydrolipoamide acetyltransferase component of pyruvate dehydrogenase complex n=2 Tax=Phaeodactylum tricornutum TaxID=2850 RepID=B7S3L5_PHATC|nr:predicted protein [Phaeodactylum tricornutum CCAP 1055/1]EEC42865.1 predicted protein [Phaeodactylum tricornutum CCAP 1055/1]|eukprot:XP_002176158.1 predicted protein [Phaeodactylum tricornutum CCAP 1055/1]